MGIQFIVLIFTRSCDLFQLFDQKLLDTSNDMQKALSQGKKLASPAQREGNTQDVFFALVLMSISATDSVLDN